MDEIDYHSHVRRLTTLAVIAALGACSPAADDGRRTIVASFYPLAYLAERIAGPAGWAVVDLSAGRTDAHDLELTLDDRRAIEEADVVLYLGDFGFQPEVEQAVEDANGTVISVADDIILGRETARDPHVWLHPELFTRLAQRIESSLEDIDPGPAARYDDHGLAVELITLHTRYERTLRECRYRTMIVSHEAFGYLADFWKLRQFGLAGLEPEGEPTADRIAAARRLIDAGEAGAVFHDGTAESVRIAESIANDAGVPALRLRTLEVAPQVGDYLSVMRANLEALEEGLGCG